MNKVNTLATMLILSCLVLVPAGLATDATNSVTIPGTCGLSLSVSSIGFGTVTAGAESAENSTVITNDGSIATDVSVNGSIWSGTTPDINFTVTQTHFSNASAVAYGSQTAMTIAQQTLESDVVNGESIDLNMKLAVPTGQTADTYTQIITLLGSC